MPFIRWQLRPFFREVFMVEKFEALSAFKIEQPDETSLKLLEDVQLPEGKREIGVDLGPGGGAPRSSDLRTLSMQDVDRLHALNAAEHLKNLIPNEQEGISKQDIERKLTDRSLSCNELRALQWMHEKYSELKTRWRGGWLYNPLDSHITPESFKKHGMNFLFPKT